VCGEQQLIPSKGGGCRLEGGYIRGSAAGGGKLEERLRTKETIESAGSVEGRKVWVCGRQVAPAPVKYSLHWLRT
jgi:hypothetical protein